MSRVFARRVVRIMSALAVSWLMVLSPATADTSNDDVKQKIGAATAAFQSGKFRRALQEFHEADKASGGRSWEAVVGVVSSELQLGRFENAEADAQRLLTLAETSEELGLANHLLGTALAAGDHLEEAEVAFRKALELRTGRPHRTRVSLATVLCRTGREDEAMSLLDDDGYCADQAVPTWRRTYRQRPVRVEDGGLVSPPVKISGPDPVYTGASRAEWIQGNVILDSIIGPDGNVKCVRVIEGLPGGLSCSAAVAVMDWRFEPATKEGVPVEVAYVLKVLFDLDIR
jgi:Flp pilus assembly protein TadD